jgi:hypothetical protein
MYFADVAGSYHEKIQRNIDEKAAFAGRIIIFKQTHKIFCIIPRKTNKNFCYFCTSKPL